MTSRISWDDYFMQTADLASVRSPCERLKVGCVLVKNNRLISMGYNGFLAGTNHTSIVRDGHEQATIHAEINAITDAAKRGASIDDCVAYVTHYPCLNCYKALASSGIKNVYYKNDYKNDPVVSELGYDVGVIKTNNWDLRFTLIIPEWEYQRHHVRLHIHQSNTKTSTQKTQSLY